MRSKPLIGLFWLLWFSFTAGHAQNIGGFWLGVTYPTDPNQAVYNYTMTLTQTGNTLGGTAQTANPNVPFSGVAYISGQVSPAVVTFGESDQNGSTAVKNICYWRGKLVYNPVDESLIGTYENIVNGTTCTSESGGKVELYRIVLKSGSTYCKGSQAKLVVTGKNIRWYSSAAKTTLLASGNTYTPQIAQTTTYYITQTLYQNESPAVPITVTANQGPAFTATSSNTGCDKANGSVVVTAADTTGWQYKLDNGAFQKKPLFSSLSPGSYTVVVKDAAGCEAAQPVTITADAAPTISSLSSTPPQCATANGEVSVVAMGGKAPLTYSINYGVTFQPDPIFKQLAGGAYTVRVRDANGCEVNRAVSLPAFKPMTVLSTTIVPTTCGQANGQMSMTVGGGRNPVQYKTDKSSLQTSPLFTGLQAGTYQLTAQDSLGCTISQSMSIAASTGPPVADMKAVTEGCGLKNGAIAITSNRTGNPLDYSLDGQTFQRTTDFSGLTAGTYILTLRDDKNCIAKQTIQIRSDCANLIHLPTAFSPNADRQNDALTIYFTIPSLTISQFTVYDRWGAVLFSRANFAVSSGESLWDGQVNGQKAPAGMYTYRLDCQFPDGTQTSYRESVALLN